MKPIGVGIVGVGAISGIYLKNITETFHDLQIIGICDLIPERAQKAQEQYPTLEIFPDMHALFSDPRVEIVLNLTRPYEHFDVSREALLAGKHVYTEKPLGAERQEGLKLASLAREKGLLLCGAPDTFLGAGLSTCRRLIDDGFIGKPIGAAAFMLCRGHEGWHPDPDFYYQRGGGPLMDMGPYYLTALVSLLGRVTTVQGVAGHAFDKRLITSKEHCGESIDVNVPTDVRAILQFEEGAVGTVHVSFDTYYPFQARLEIYGTAGTLLLPDPNNFGGPIQILRPENGKEPVDMPLLYDYPVNSRGLGLADMAHAIQSGEKPRADLSQILHVLDIMESIYDAAREGKTINIASDYQQPKPMANNPLPGRIEGQRRTQGGLCPP